MSAQEQMRAMLDQLMGTQRDGLEDDGQEQIHFTDSVVCKSFLLGGYGKPIERLTFLTSFQKYRVE